MAIKGKKTGAGAPTKSRGRREGYQVNLADEERDLIDTEARFAGHDRSSLMRVGSIAYARQLRALRLGPQGDGGAS